MKNETTKLKCQKDGYLSHLVAQKKLICKLELPLALKQTVQFFEDQLSKKLVLVF